VTAINIVTMLVPVSQNPRSCSLGGEPLAV
jgi:hypothetical protein